jgi:(p)ppGpp synthase/HD superfamily hydrolase
MTLSEKALEFATKIHAKQFRNDGVTPYIEHCKAVKEIAINYANKILFKHIQNSPYVGNHYQELDNIGAIAYLHDSIEDQGVTNKQLSNIGMTDDIIDVINIVSRQSNESYFDFILRIINSDDGYAFIVKWADLTHNLSDLKSGSLKDKYMLARYLIEQQMEDWGSTYTKYSPDNN